MGRLHDSHLLSIPLLALQLSCSDRLGGDLGDADDVGDGDGDGGDPCTSPGDIVEGVEPFVPPEGTPPPTCSTGWASDAPLRAADWAISLEDPHDYVYGAYQPVVVKALVDGSALFVGADTLRWFDGVGGAAETAAHGFIGISSDAVVIRDSDQHVFIASRVGDIGDERPKPTTMELREFYAGELVAAVQISTPPQSITTVGGLVAVATDEWLIAGNQSDLVSYTTESFVMRVDSVGTELMRVAFSTDAEPAEVALDAAGNLVFGQPYLGQWRIIDAVDGAVIVDLLDLDASNVVGLQTGDGFMSVGWSSPGPNDGRLTLLDGVGVSQSGWTYDRATVTDDLFRDIANGVDGGFVVGGADGTWWDPADLYDLQPVVIGVDAVGNATWKGRMAVSGDANSVDVAVDGTVVAAGGYYTPGVNSFFEPRYWIASWTPQ